MRANTNKRSSLSVSAIARIYAWHDVLCGPYNPDHDRLKTAASHLSENELMESAIPSYFHANQFIRALFIARGNIIMKWITESDYERVLDVGCGAGILLESVQNTDASKPFGIDVAPEAARAYLSEGHRGCILRSDARHLPFPDNSFDAVVAMDVLEHFDNLEDATREIERVIASDGELLISGPTESWLYKVGRVLAEFSGGYHPSTIGDVEQVVKKIFAPTNRQRELKIGCTLFRLTSFTHP